MRKLFSDTLTEQALKTENKTPCRSGNAINRIRSGFYWIGRRFLRKLQNILAIANVDKKSCKLQLANFYVHIYMEKFISFLDSYCTLSDQVKNDLRENIGFVELDKKKSLLKNGKVCQNLYFVETGLLKQYYRNQEKEIVDYFAYENKIVSGIGSLFRQIPSFKIIETIEPSTLYSISYSCLEKLFAKHHDLERAGRLIAIDAFIRMEERILSLQFHTAKKRYDDFMHNNPNILQRSPLSDVASYLGMTQVTLSRVRNQK